MKMFKNIISRLKKVIKISNTNNRVCPICSWEGYQFNPGGIALKMRFDCLCPNCGSMERHRLAFMVATKYLQLDYSNVLHVPPEKELTKIPHLKVQ